MKNIYKVFLFSAALAGSAGSFTGCSDFLKEDLITDVNTQIFETEEGLDKLAVGVYNSLAFHFNYEWAYTLQQYGADEMAVANDAIFEYYNSYTANFEPTIAGDVASLWNNMYSYISSANMLIANVPKYYNQNSGSYNARLGEGHFFRAYNYFRLVQQYGGVPMLTEPVLSDRTEFSRNTAEEIYALVISDLRRAYELLPENPGQRGRLTKYAAAHFLAKACLFRASEQNDSFNASTKAQDLNDVIKYATEVTQKHPLAANFSDLWNFDKPNSASENNNEIVLSAQFSDNATTQGRYGNQVHLYYPSIYQNIAGMRRDIAGGREFSRLRTTNYAIDVYDRMNDSRFWKSFITTYRCNNPDAAPAWGAYAPEGKSATDKKFLGGEIAIKYIVNDAGDTRYSVDNVNNHAPHTFVRYFAGEAQSFLGTHGNNGSYATKSRYAALGKFRDGSRVSVASAFGQRDGILARSAEDYLMVAEAYIRKGEFDNALPFINTLRERGGYVDGENRESYVDGGVSFINNPACNTVKGDGGSGLRNGFAAYSEVNTYKESNNLTAVPTTSTRNSMRFNSVSDILNSTKEFYSVLNATSDSEKMLVYIMNERSRELMGELHRWPDLARSHQLEKRFKAFNDGSQVAGSDFRADKHYLRPLPQSFLDAITQGGKPLTPAQKSAMQNPNW